MQFQSFNKLVLITAIFLMVFFTADAKAQAETSSLLGHWVGGYEIDGEWHFVEARFESRGDQIVGGLDFRFDMTTNTFVNALSVTGDDVQFELDKDNTHFMFAGNISGNKFGGTIRNGSGSGKFSLQRVYELEREIVKGYIGNYQLDDQVILFHTVQGEGVYYLFNTHSERSTRIYPLSANLFYSELGETVEVRRHDDGSAVSLVIHTANGGVITASRVNPYQVEEVQYPHGEMTIAGTLMLPDSPGPHPAIVIMHGTGPNNRDFFRFWGHYFAEAGIAALVYDKPGAFESAHPSLGSFWENSVQDLANAALAGVHYLQSRPEINPQQVGIRTFSNSSWAGPLASSQSDDVAFLMGTAVSGVAQRQADVFQDDLNNISYYDYPEWAADTALEYLRFTREFSIFARQLNLPIPPPIRDYYGQDFDPLTAWANVTQPILVVNGELDTKVDPVDAVARIEQTLKQNNHTDYTLVVYPDAEHGLLQSETGLGAETSGRSDNVFAPGVMKLQTDWVLARFDGNQITTYTTQTVDSPVPVQISAHFEENGRYELLPWYGRSTWQLILFLLFTVVFGVAVIGLPVAAVVRHVRRQNNVGENMSSAQGGNGRILTLLIWSASLLSLWLITGLVLTWVNIVHMVAGAFFGLPGFLNSLPILAPVAALLIIAIGVLVIRAWRNGNQSMKNAIFTITSLLFIWYLSYWHLLIG